MPDPLLRMPLTEYGKLVRAAFEEGYTQGSAHPKRASIFAKRAELSALFWRVCESRIKASDKYRRAAQSPTAEPRVSPQQQQKCACPSWTSARDCIRHRYGDSDHDEACECACHEDADGA